MIDIIRPIFDFPTRRIAFLINFTIVNLPGTNH